MLVLLPVFLTFVIGVNGALRELEEPLGSHLELSTQVWMSIDETFSDDVIMKIHERSCHLLTARCQVFKLPFHGIADLVFPASVILLGDPDLMTTTLR